MKLVGTPLETFLETAAGEIQVAQSVWESYVSAPKTNQSRGSVPVIRPLAQMLEAHRMRCGNPSAGPIFAAVNGKPLNLKHVLRRMILPVLERCEVCRVSKAKHVGAEHKFVRDKSLPKWHGWHAGRRGLGTNLYRLGVPEKIIQAILRHANVSTTNTYYIKTASADAQAAMAKLESVIPQLGNNWATESDSPKTPVAVN